MNLENFRLSEKKKDTKGHILHDFIYMKCQEQENPEKQSRLGD